jgi:hypothetical protein
MVIQAVKENRPMVVADGSTRRIFDTYAMVVDEAFDFVDRFDRAPE